ncbi:TPA: hypothetical protein DF272_02430 [Candidatus Falkowbacteria bacterium]|nr:hypothetical protein [Candidatus Falkowbacteria bacterium]
MGLSVLYSLLVSLVGALPIMLTPENNRWHEVARSSKIVASVIAFVCYSVISWVIIYFAQPSLVYPMWGWYFGLIVGWWVVSAIVAGTWSEMVFPVGWFPLGGLLVVLIVWVIGWSLFRADEYYQIIGEVETREWTADFSQADPKHLRMVPKESAKYRADTSLGNAKDAAIGSQFKIDYDHMTRQKVRGELWWVVPLDYSRFTVWTSVDFIPGYIMIHAEDPSRDVELVLDRKMVYSPGASFHQNLERYLWANGYSDEGMTDFSFEVDDDGNPWWIVTIFEPTIGYSGWKVTGIVMVNPETGEIMPKSPAEIPDFVDRVYPRNLAATYMSYWGNYWDGWGNAVWGKDNLRDPSPFGNETDAVELVFDHNGEPYWFTGITSSNQSDDALVGVMYMHSRTGKAVYYRVSGKTEMGILQSINTPEVIAQLGGEGTTPILYNFYGRPTWFSVLVTKDGVYKGVALADLDTSQVFFGKNQFEALRALQSGLQVSGRQISPMPSSELTAIEGPVERIGQEINNGRTIFYFYLTGSRQLFSATTEISPEVPMTRVGDRVSVRVNDSSEAVIPIAIFENLDLNIQYSPREMELLPPAALPAESEM